MPELTDTGTGYGRIQALKEIRLRLGTGETLAVPDPDGAGKPILPKPIAGPGNGIGLVTFARGMQIVRSAFFWGPWFPGECPILWRSCSLCHWRLVF